MIFEKNTPIEFDYMGEKVVWGIQRLEKKDWIDTENLNWQVSCQHKVFTDIFNSSLMITTSLATLVEIGRKENIIFFTEMQDSFMNYPFEN
jgi:hypothetical protein